MHRSLTALAIAVTASTALPAQGSRGTGSVYLERIGWMDAERLLTPDAVVVVTMGAASKEHGPHLPLATDFLQADFIKQRVAERTPVIVAPPIQYGYYPPFAEYPGSTTLRFSVARDVVEDVCPSIARTSNARRFYIISHGPIATPVMEHVRSELEVEGLAVRFLHWDDAKKPIAAQIREQKEGSHADEMETSMLLYIAPDVVKMDRAVTEYGAAPTPDGRMIGDRPGGRGSFSPSGVYGDPRVATAAKGKQLTEAVIDAAVRDIAELRAAPLPPKPSADALFAEVAGRYVASAGDTIVAARDGDMLALTRPGQPRVRLQAAGRFRFGLWTTEARFIAGADNRVAYLLLTSGASEIVARRVE